MSKNRHAKRIARRGERPPGGHSIPFWKAVLLCFLVFFVRVHFGSADASPATNTFGCSFLTTSTSQNVTLTAPAAFTGFPAGAPTKSLVIINEGTTNALWVNTNGGTTLSGGLASVGVFTTNPTQTWRVPPGGAINPDGQFTGCAVIADTSGNTTCTIIASY